MAVVVSFVGKWDGKDVARAQKEIAKFSDESTSKFGNFAKKAGVAVAAVGAAAVGVGAVFAKQAISAAEEAATAQARLEQVAQSMGFVGGAYSGATQRLQDYASELSKQIAVEDESILAVQAKLATFREVGATMDEAGGAMDRATQAAFNLAAAGFGEAESNATQLGKALQDPVKGITALARAGVTFTEQEKEKIKAMVEAGDVAGAQNLILGALEAQVGGVAEATANASEKMAVGFGELQESVGMALLPAFNELVDTLLPVFEELQGPLAEIAKTVGGALSDALKAVSPLIGPLAEAFAKVAGTVAGVLVQAVEALIPALLPILDVISNLADRAAPLLEKILGKVAQVLVRVLDALVPLLDPLLELVFGILDAAWPIIETVIDVFLLLVDAVTPLLDAVVMLLQPLGKLIEVGLKALMPVIEPLLPVIEALALVLSDVLTRAIGLIMSGIGGLILAFSKLYPFILKNVTTPIVDNFLKFAETLVGAAEAAFSWVPGLGDKLSGAKDAVARFRVDATKAISGAADKIAEEGERIGQGLIDQGVEAMTNPDAIRRTREAGRTAGTALSDGMRIGIDNGQIPVQAATRGLVMSADAAARRAGEIRSPSKLFERIGNALADGLEKGLKDRSKKVAERAKEAIQAAADAAREAIAEFDAYRTSVADSIVGLLDLGQAYEDYTARQQAVTTTLAELTKYQATIQGEATDEQKEKLKELQLAYQAAQTDAANGAQSIVEEFIQQGERINKFNDNLQTLLKAGLSKSAFDAIVSQGMDRGADIAAALVQGNVTENARRVSEVYTSVQRMGETTGQQAAVTFHATGVNLALQMLEGLIKEFLPAGRKRKELLQTIKGLNDSIQFDTKFIDVVTRVNGAAPAGGGGGGGGGGGVAAAASAAASAAESFAGAAANAQVAAQFSQQVISNAQRLNAAAAAGQDVTKLGFTKSDWAELAKLEQANIRAMATGGIVTGPTLALIGEAGPEAVVPLSRGNGIGPNISITVNAGFGTDGAEVGRQVVDALKAYERRNGSVYVSA